MRVKYGSSPRAWGRWALWVTALPAVPRFIPTCVGQIAQGGGGGDEDVRFIPTCVGQMHWTHGCWRLPWRFIPTCVGQMVNVRLWSF